MVRWVCYIQGHEILWLVLYHPPALPCNLPCDGAQPCDDTQPCDGAQPCDDTGSTIHIEQQALIRITHHDVMSTNMKQ